MKAKKHAESGYDLKEMEATHLVALLHSDNGMRGPSVCPAPDTGGRLLGVPGATVRLAPNKGQTSLVCLKQFVVCLELLSIWHPTLVGGFS